MIKHYGLTIHNTADIKQEVVLFGGMHVYGKPSTDSIREIKIFGDYNAIKEDYYNSPITITSLFFSDTVHTEIHTEDLQGHKFMRKVVCQKHKMYNKADGLFYLNPFTTMCLTLEPNQRIDLDLSAAVHHPIIVKQVR